MNTGWRIRESRKSLMHFWCLALIVGFPFSPSLINQGLEQRTAYLSSATEMLGLDFLHLAKSARIEVGHPVCGSPW
jgi:hypothetical protein